MAIGWCANLGPDWEPDSADALHVRIIWTTERSIMRGLARLARARRKYRRQQHDRHDRWEFELLEGTDE